MGVTVCARANDSTATAASRPIAALRPQHVVDRVICHLLYNIRILSAAVVLLTFSAATAGSTEPTWLSVFEQGDFATAITLLRPAAEDGDARAQYRLGLIFDFGLGTPVDLIEAARWYRAAAGQANTEARIALGRLYERGGDALAERSAAAAWLRITTQQPGAELAPDLVTAGVADAAGALSEFGQWLRGVSSQPPSSPPGAITQVTDAPLPLPVEYLRDQARRGDAPSQVRLAGIYHAGAAGLPPDIVRAYVWYSLAVASAAGEERRRASGYRQALERRMSAAQVKEALDRAGECLRTKIATCD